MKNKKIKSFSLVFLKVSLVIVSLVLSKPMESTSTITPNASVAHDPIHIHNNTELDAFCAGDGTDGLSWETAHVIENYEIDGGSLLAVLIANTNRFLIIQSCTFTGAHPQAGSVLFDACENINITLCSILGGGWDLLATEDCNNIWITDNTISGVGYGVDLWKNNTNVHVTGNTIDAGTGVLVRDSEYINITDNTGTVTGLYGILLDDTVFNPPNPPRYNTVNENCFKGDALTEQVKDEGEYNYVYDNGCAIIPGYSWIIVIAVALSITSIIAVKFYAKRK